MADEPKLTPWWQTLPAVIAGLATLITALAGLVGALSQLGLFRPSSVTPTPSVAAVTPAPTQLITPTPSVVVATPSATPVPSITPVTAVTPTAIPKNLNVESTVKASEERKSELIVNLIHAIDERNWGLVTTYTVDGATDYFGRRNVTKADIRKDLEQDARTYRWSKSYPDLSTFHREIRDGIAYESIGERTESLEYSGRHHEANCLFEISYRNVNPPAVLSLSLKVLK